MQKRYWTKSKNLFMIKNTQHTANRNEHPQPDKGHLWDNTANSMVTGETLKAFGSRARQGCLLSSLLFSVVL